MLFSSSVLKIAEQLLLTWMILLVDSLLLSQEMYTDCLPLEIKKSASIQKIEWTCVLKVIEDIKSFTNLLSNRPVGKLHIVFKCIF